MTRPEPLFSKAPIAGKRTEAEAAILAAVEGASLSRLGTPAVFADAVTDACAPHPPVLLREAIQFRVFEEPVEVEDSFGHIELRPGVTTELHVPFLGPADYFDLWAVTMPAKPPRGRVERRTLVLSLSAVHPDGSSARKHFARDLDRIDGMLDDQRRYCDQIRPELLEAANAAIKTRRMRQTAMSTIRARLVAEGYAPMGRRRRR